MEPTDRIDDLEARLREARDRFESPADPPDEDRAMRILREGFGPTVWIYVEGRTGGRMVQFSPEEFSRLERLMNEWLALYARCYGAEIESEATLRTAAEALVETHNVRDVAQLLTNVPSRTDERNGDHESG